VNSFEWGNHYARYAGQIQGRNRPWRDFQLLRNVSNLCVYLVPKTATIGAEFRLNSGFFVIDSPEMIRGSGSSLVATMSFAWDEKSKSLLPVPDCDGYAQPVARADAR